MSQSSNIKLTVSLLTIFMIVLVAGFVYRIQQPRLLNEAELKVNGLYLLETPRRFEQLNLVDHHGQPFERESLIGHWTLIFFGFTYCPDICPAALSFLNQFVSGLEPDQAAATHVVMVSVDPARDSVEQLASYVPFFNEDFLGVTGEFLDIHRFATALNTPFRKVPGEAGNYLVDHSANVVLVNPRGDYHGFFKSPLDLEKMNLTYTGAIALWDDAH
ncbi:MAG: SCO family protein [Pseudomonadota bacterium]